MKKTKKSGRGERALRVRVKTARGRKTGSTRWLERQLNDPYVRRARHEGWRSRAAFKLLEIDEKFRLLRPGLTVLDLGCAPGGWCQVAVAAVNALNDQSARPVGRVVGVDLLSTEPVLGAEMVQMDFLADDADTRLAAILGGRADVILSDMAAPMVGHQQTDHRRTMALAEAVFCFAEGALSTGGAVVTKTLSGGAPPEVQQELKRRFGSVRHVKPPASRKESSERYLVAQGWCQ